VALCLLAPACAPSQGPSVRATGTMDQIRSKHTLNVGYFVFEPTIMEEPNTHKLSGVFVDMIESIAKAMDVSLSYHKVDLANFAAGLQSHQYDLSIGATFATPQRAVAVLFTRPIFYAGYTGVVPKGKAKGFPTWQSMDRAGLRVAVKQGSAIDDFVRDNFKHAQIVRLAGADLNLPLTAVSSGQADVGLMNQLTVFTYLRSHPELEEVLSTNSVAPTYFSWAVRPDDSRWRDYLNTCIDYLENTGDTYRFESKYGIPLLHAKQQLVFPEMSYPQYWALRATEK
jgi:ABC-type amino acid transport substrate-binding protein